MEEQALLDLLDSGQFNNVLLALTMQKQLGFALVQARLLAFDEVLSWSSIWPCLDLLSSEDLEDLAQYFVDALGNLLVAKADFPFFFKPLYGFWGGGPNCKGYEWSSTELASGIGKFYLNRAWRDCLRHLAQRADLNLHLQYFCAAYVSLRSEACLVLMRDLWDYWPNQAGYLAYYLAEAAYLSGAWSEALSYYQFYLKDRALEPLALNSFFCPTTLNPRLERAWGLWAGLDFASFRLVECYPQTHGFAPNHLEAYWRLGACYEALGELDLALEAYAEACACCPAHELSPHLAWADLAQKLSLPKAVILQARLKAWSNYHNNFSLKRYWRFQFWDSFKAWSMALDGLYYQHYLGQYQRSYPRYLAFFDQAWASRDWPAVWAYAKVLLEILNLEFLSQNRQDKAWHLAVLGKLRHLLTRLHRRFRKPSYDLSSYLSFLAKFIKLLEVLEPKKEDLQILWGALLADVVYLKAKLLYLHYRDIWQIKILYKRYASYLNLACYAVDSARFWRYLSKF